MKEFYVVCDNIRRLENIGSIFRTADALGVSKIFLCGISGKPPHHKISKTALGAENNVPWEYYRQTGRLIDIIRKPTSAGGFGGQSGTVEHIHAKSLDQEVGEVLKKILEIRKKDKEASWQKKILLRVKLAG